MKTPADPRRAPSTKGFTLIELLVVIAIIAILAAILFPVFAQAKGAAKKAVNVSNVKQICLGTMMYLGDSDDVYPPQNTRQSSTLLSFWWFGYDNATDTAIKKGGLLQPYMKNVEINVPPTMPGNVLNDYYPDSTSDPKPFNGYGINSNVVVGLRIPNYGSWERPAESLLLTDAAALYGDKVYQVTETYYPYYLDYINGAAVQGRNNGETAVVGWMDGHVGSKKVVYATPAQSPNADKWKAEHLGFLPGPGGLAPLSVNPLVNFYYQAAKPAGS